MTIPNIIILNIYTYKCLEETVKFVGQLSIVVIFPGNLSLPLAIAVCAPQMSHAITARLAVAPASAP